MLPPTLARTLSCALLLATCACQTYSEYRLESMLNDTVRIVRENGGTDALPPQDQAELRERYDKVRAWYDQRKFTAGDEYLVAAMILLTSEHEDDLIAAGQMAAIAAQMGDFRALQVQAQATDRILVRRGEPQRYGTQYAYSRATERWEHFPTDPATTDKMRSLMGVQPLAQLEARVTQLNKQLDAAREASKASD